MDNHFTLDIDSNTLKVKRHPIQEVYKHDHMGLLDANYHGSAELLIKKCGRDWFRFDGFALDRFVEVPLVLFFLHLFCDVWSFHRTVNGEPPPVIDIIQLFRMARTVSEKYSSTNYYHTIIHGMDVTHSMSCLLIAFFKSGIFTMERQEVFIAMMAALMHDIDHPGVTYDYFYDKDIHNFFKSKNMVSNESPLTDEPLRTSYHYRQQMRVGSKRYLHSLESHQASMAVSTMLCSGMISHLPEQQQRQLCSLMFNLVEATDMSLHQSLSNDISSLAGLFDSGFKPYIKSHERLLLLCFMVKCSDISNPTKDWSSYFTWSRLITAEFFAQGDKERYIRGCLNPNKFVTPFCDRNLVNFEQSQIGFIKFIYESFSNLDSILQSELTRRIMIRLDINLQTMLKIRDVMKLENSINTKNPPAKLEVKLMLRDFDNQQPAAHRLKCCLLLCSRDRSSSFRRSLHSMQTTDPMQLF